MSEQKGPTFLRLLLNKFFTGKQDALPKLLPKEEWDTLSATLIAQKDPELSLFLPNQWLSSIDISWLGPTLLAMPKPLQEVYLAAFPTELGQALGQKAVEGQVPRALSPQVKEFLLSFLFTLWKDKEVKPKELIPTWELSPLLKLPRAELLEIVDLLAMYDLVEEMRQIVDKRLLQAIIQYLTPAQNHYLRVLLRQKSSHKPSPLSVKELLKEGKKFPQMLHKFGLTRFALALSGANDDFTWHILHTFDINRAKFLMGQIQKEEIANQTPLAQMQVQHIIQFLKTETSREQ